MPLLFTYREELLASDAAERLRGELRDAEATTELENVVVAEPSPWDDMRDTDGSVFCVDDCGFVSIQRGAMPCTECGTQHSGYCSRPNLLLADMTSLNHYADVFLPHGVEFYELRG